MKKLFKKLVSVFILLSLCGSAIASPWGGSLMLAPQGGVKPIVVVYNDNPSTVSGYTPDGGITWTTPTIASGKWIPIAWNGSKFAAAVQNTTTAAISSDGQTWTPETISSATSGVLSIVYGNGIFVAFENSLNKDDVSADGITWTQHTMNTGLSVPTSQGAAYNGSVFCAITQGSNVAGSSADGVTWTAQTLPSSSSWRAIAWNGSVFTAVILNSSTTATSPDCHTWTSHASALPFAGAGSIVSDGNQFVAAPQNAGTTAATSPDGVTWTTRTLPSSMTGILVWNGSSFVLVGNGVGANSPTGVTWSSITPPSHNPQGVIAKNLTFGSF